MAPSHLNPDFVSASELICTETHRKTGLGFFQLVLALSCLYTAQRLLLYFQLFWILSLPPTRNQAPIVFTEVAEM